MFCTQCGAQLDDSARFCTACGKAVGGAGGAADTGMPPAAETTAAAVPRLHRIIGKKKIAGVCAGFAEYFGTDVSLMRIIWLALLLLPPNIGLIAYIVAWVVLPKG
jgi:phage shock protein C